MPDGSFRPVWRCRYGGGRSPEPQKRIGGVALLVTLAAVAVLTTVTLAFNQRARLNLAQTGVFKDRVAAAALATAGIQAGMALLARDYHDVSHISVQQDWADPEVIADLLAGLELPADTLMVQIEDELGKIQINALLDEPYGQHFNNRQKILWERFLENTLSLHGHTTDDAISTIINSLKDWLDAGDDEAVTGLDGAETDYYQSLPAPYACRNGPLPLTDELMLVRGVTSELFHGTETAPGMNTALTVYGAQKRAEGYIYPGKININTAPVTVLMALLPAGAEALALEMAAYRLEGGPGNYRHDLTNPLWYRNITGMAGIALDAGLITTTSDVFRIQAVAGLAQTRVAITAVVQIEARPESGVSRTRLLSWKQD